MRCVPAILTALALTALLAGCGGEGEVQRGATATVYVDSGLCDEAQRVLAAEGETGEIPVRAVCLPDPRRGGRLDLAAVGANARRATEDSTAIAFIAPADDPALARFAGPILESAGIPRVAAASGAAGMREVLAAVAEPNSGSLRETVADALEDSS